MSCTRRQPESASCSNAHRLAVREQRTCVTPVEAYKAVALAVAAILSAASPKKR